MSSIPKWACLVILIAAVSLTAAKRIHWQVGNDTFTPPASPSPTLIDSRIVGGLEAAEGSAPYQISIQTIWRTHICGGVIVSDRWILTAGHCMLDFSIEDLLIIVGTNNHTAPGQVLRPQLSVVHCMYDIPTMYSNDIAVVRLNDTIRFNNHTQPIELSREQPPAGVVVTLTGWGSPQLNSPPTERLQRIDLRVVAHDECKALWNDHDGVDIGHMCTHTVAGTAGSCSGDSGGPLIWQDKLVGLVNWGSPCARGLPDMHSNTIYYLDCIKRAIARCNIIRN